MNVADNKFPDHKLPDDAICLQCTYSLRETRSNLCPECGKRFDRFNPRTFLLREHPRTIWLFPRLRWGLVAGMAMLAAFLSIIALIWSWAMRMSHSFIGDMFGMILAGILTVIACVILIGLWKILVWNEY